MAIRSTVGRLIGCLPQKVNANQSHLESVSIGEVDYIDYISDTFPLHNTFCPYVHKRREFRHEQEVRAVLIITDAAAADSKAGAATGFRVTEMCLLLTIDMTPASARRRSGTSASAAKRRLYHLSTRPDMSDPVEDAYDDHDEPFTVTEYLDTAAELIDALRPTNARWGGQSLRWIFRGHANAGWELVPSALRKSAWRDFKPEYDPEVLQQAERDLVEWEILKEFGDRLDRAGLPIPGKTRGELDRQDPRKLPANWVLLYVQLAALAQHHGLPTRLLDFTRSGLIAAYFAALEPPDGPPERFCVWAIDGSFFTLGHGYEDQGTGLALVRGSRAFNVNQHAQDGLLGMWETPSSLGDGKGGVSLLELMDFIRLLAPYHAKKPVCFRQACMSRCRASGSVSGSTRHDRSPQWDARRLACSTPASSLSAN
ncbi:MAG TPA: FRG domain-containing protein, partial [Polyangiaceae bacterium]|nr:FRG domain-containing protein [Polyangiaceae bacterium]